MTRWTRRAIRWGVTGVILVLLVLFARTVDWGATWTAIRGASPLPLVAAALVNIFSLVLKGLRWWVFLDAIDAASVGVAMRATMAGAGLNNVLVANGGDAARVVFLSRHARISSATILATLALERLFDIIGYVVLLVVTTFILPLPHDIARFRIPAAVVLLVIGVLLAWLARRPATAAGEEALEAVADADLPASMAARLRVYLGRFAGTMRDISSGPRYVSALVLSLLAWICQVACYHWTARAVHFPITLTGTVATVLAVNLVLVARPTPGNVGFFQFMYALTTTALGLDRNTAIGVAFLIQALQIIPVTLLGVALAPEFVFRRHRPPELPSA